MNSKEYELEQFFIIFERHTTCVQHFISCLFFMINERNGISHNVIHWLLRVLLRVQWYRFKENKNHQAQAVVCFGIIKSMSQLEEYAPILYNRFWQTLVLQTSCSTKEHLINLLILTFIPKWLEGEIFISFCLCWLHVHEPSFLPIFLYCESSLCIMEKLKTI